MMATTLKQKGFPKNWWHFSYRTAFLVYAVRCQSKFKCINLLDFNKN